MSEANANAVLAAEVLTTLRAAGVFSLVVCPGGRNAPLVLAADASREAFEVLHFFEERSAAFFALGRIRRDNRPVAVITTSGTAAAELLPAMLEAVHGGWPLIAVTADRPRALRGTGAPQTIDQAPLFTAARVPVLDIDAPGQLASLPSGAFHLNVCFDEPLATRPVALAAAAEARAEPRRTWITETEAGKEWGDFFKRVRNPLVLVSSLTEEESRAVAPWLASLSSPLYLEEISQLRGHRDLQEFSLHSGENILTSRECRATCDGVLRIGGVPTPRLWRELDGDPRPVLHVSRVPFPGLSRQEPVLPLAFFGALANGATPSGNDCGQLLRRDRSIAAATTELLAREPRSEAALVRAIAGRIPENARILLGNSLAIREWDLAVPRTETSRTFFANRGVNGIDGLVSTALGLAGAGRPAAAVIGDLSALYDLAGLWPAARSDGADMTIAVINNGGGKIFGGMFHNTAFLNAHALHFRGWAEMFGWHYARICSAMETWPPESPRLVEIVPDEEATTRFSQAYSGFWD